MRLLKCPLMKKFELNLKNVFNYFSKPQLFAKLLFECSVKRVPPANLFKRCISDKKWNLQLHLAFIKTISVVPVVGKESFMSDAELARC